MDRRTFRSSRNGVDTRINNERFVNQFNDAQIALDNQVMIDTDRFVPFDQGILAGSVESPAPGLVEYRALHARYQYYLESTLGRVPNYNTAEHPDATSMWFEASKAVNKQAWINLVKNIGGGG